MSSAVKKNFVHRRALLIPIRVLFFVDPSFITCSMMKSPLEPSKMIMSFLAIACLICVSSDCPSPRALKVMVDASEKFPPFRMYAVPASSEHVAQPQGATLLLAIIGNSATALNKVSKICFIDLFLFFILISLSLQRYVFYLIYARKR